MAYLGVKFHTVLMDQHFPRDVGIDELKKWCAEFYNHGFTPEYEGGSAGNLSYRVKEGEDEFIITGAGIVSKAKVLDNSLVRVKSCDVDKEIAYYYGARKPSSESLVHYAIYRVRKDVNAVFHGHSDRILACADRLGVVQTKQYEPEGTARLAKAVLEVLGDENFIVMKDHGFISMGGSMKEAGELAIKMQQMCV